MQELEAKIDKTLPPKDTAHSGHGDHCGGAEASELIDGEYGMVCPYCSGLVRPHEAEPPKDTALCQQKAVQRSDTLHVELEICDGCDDPDCETCCDREMRAYVAESPKDTALNPETTEDYCQGCSGTGQARFNDESGDDTDPCMYCNGTGHMESLCTCLTDSLDPSDHRENCGFREREDGE